MFYTNWPKYNQKQVKFCNSLKTDAGLKVDSLGKAETLNAQFQKVFTQEDVSAIPHKGLPSTISMEQIVFDAEGIRNLLQNLNS